MPPKEGLHEQTPRFEAEGVTSAVRAPDRAEAAEASVPAWPPPMTTTSYGLLLLSTPAYARSIWGANLERSNTVANLLYRESVDRTRGL